MAGGDREVSRSLVRGDEISAVADLVPALISFYSYDHICLYANAYHRDWCAKEPDSYVGLHMRDCIGESLYEDYQPYLARVARGETVGFQSVAPHRDGGTCRSEIRFAPAYGPRGAEGFHIVVTFPDESEHAHKQFLKSEYRYRNMFQAMAVAFWECDFTGVGAALRQLRAEGVNDLRRHFAENPAFIRLLIRQTRIVDVNQKTIELFRGESKADFLGSNDPYWPRESEPVFAKAVLAAVGRVPYFQEETRLKRLDGAGLDALFTVSFSPEAVGEGIILVGVVDITERNQALHELQKAHSDLAHAARVSMLGELTASIAHEVNQPLAAIVSNGAASLRWLSREAPDLTEARIAIERMIEDGQRASEIVSRTRMMSSRRAQAKAPVDINGVIDDAALFLRHEFASRKTALRLDLAPRLPPALGDKVQLHQVMVNLMMNALQAMDHAPAPRELAVRAFADEGAVKVEVSDTGDGIADDAAARLFKAFYTTKENGMGMGLSICATIIEAHGGRISARNNDGRGSTFSFSLPTMDAPADHTKV